MHIIVSNALFSDIVQAHLILSSLVWKEVLLTANFHNGLKLQWTQVDLVGCIFT